MCLGSLREMESLFLDILPQGPGHTERFFKYFNIKTVNFRVFRENLQAMARFLRRKYDYLIDI